MNIAKPSTAMKTNYDRNSALETECLYGETIEIIDKHLGWVYCRLLTDGYCGWINYEDLGYAKPVTHRVISKRTFLLDRKDVKSNHIHYLPLGAQLSINKIEDNWAEVILTSNYNYKKAYVPSIHLVEINNIITDWVSVSEKLIGIPYKWGGRDTIGLDCSALLQLSYQTFGNNIPRNAIDQLQVKKKIINNINNLKRGAVIFWNGHVGIMVDNLNCIHANAFHMQTVIEPLNVIIKRMEHDNKIIKMMNFSN